MANKDGNRLLALRGMAARYADWFLRNGKWKTEANAVRALHRKHPESSIEECEEAFNDGVKLYHACMAFVQEHADTLWVRWRAVPESGSKCAAMMRVDDLVPLLHDLVPGFPPTTYEHRIQGMFFFWHVL